MFRLFGFIIVLSALLSIGIGSGERTSYAKSPRGEELCRFDGTGLSFMGHIGGTPTTIERANGYTYLATGPELLVIDDRIPTNPQIIARKVFPFRISDIAIYEETIAVTYRTFMPSGCGGGLWLGSIANPNALLTLGEVLVNRPTSVAMNQHHAYVTTDGTLYIYDVTASGAPILVGSNFIATYPIESALVNGVLAIGDRGQGMYLYSLENPIAPTLRGEYEPAGSIDGADFYGTRAVLYGFDKIDILDISDPAQPTLIQQLTVELTISKTWLAGEYLYYSGTRCDSLNEVVTCFGEVKRLNLLHPTQPTMTYNLSTAHTFAVDNHYLYLTESSGGYRVLAENNTWVESGGLALPGAIHAATVANETLWVQGGGGRLQGLTLPFRFAFLVSWSIPH